MISEQTEVEALGHDWDDGVIEPTPSCTEDGVKTFTCKRCGETKAEIVAATGHTDTDEDGICDICGSEMPTEPSEITGDIVFADLGLENSHQYTDPFTSANAAFTVQFGGGTNDGKYYNTGSGIRVYATSHGQMTVTATSGTITKIELTLDTSTTSAKVPTAEDIDTGTYDPDTMTWTGDAQSVTFTNNGTSGHWRIQALTVTVATDSNVHVHQYAEVVTAPTCTEQGFTTYTCTCGDSYVGNYVNALGHDYELTKWNWTGYTAATATFTCKNDANHVQTVNATITSARTEPTAEANGSVVYTAKVTFEGNEYTDTKTEVLPALGHDYELSGWNWTGYTAATATFKDKNSDSQITVDATITSVRTEPTCTANGKVVYTAKVTFEGNEYTDTKTETLNKLGHNYELTGWSWTGYTAATATFTCKNDASHVQTVNATITSARTEPTCTANGKVVYTAKVTFEGTDYTDTKTETLTALGHDWNAPTYTWNADNTKVTASRTCKNDASHVETETVNTTSEVTKPATCTEKGETTYTAVFENPAFTKQTKTVANIDPTGHIPGEPVRENEVAPTCEAAGSYDEVVYCTACSTELSRETKTEGTALGHDWNEPTYTWSADYSGVTAKRTCKRDESHVESETVATTSEVTKPATTEEKGETTYTAVFTNTAFATQTKTVANIDIIGLEWSEPTYVWSDDYSTVTATRVCTNKDNLVETETVNTTAEVTKPATCTEKGETTYTAEFENAAFTKQTKTVENVDALGHDYQPVVTAPTCTEQGYTTYTCSRCKDSYTDSYVDALGHDWNDPTYVWAEDNSTVTATRTCKRDESHVETETVNTTSVTQAATVDAEGQIVYTAVFENEAFETQTKTVVIPKLDPTDPCADGHDWDAPTYEWAEDNSTVTATRVCKNNAEHVETETVATTPEVTKPATYEQEGEITYTAVFENEAFETQTKAVATPKLEKPDDGLPCDGGDDCPGNIFIDMPAKGHWAHDPIDWAVVHGITSGTSANTFSPNAGCTRAQVVTFLWRAAGSPEPTSSSTPFNDVQSGSYYYKAVLWAVETGVTSGTSATTFSPNATCTRAQIVTFIWRYEKSPEVATGNNPFTDVTAGAYYEKAVLWASETGVTAGTSATTFSPNATCTRAQIVTFLYRDMTAE